MDIKKMLLKFSRMNGKDMSGLSPSELAEAGTDPKEKISEAELQRLLKMLGTTSAKPKPRPFKNGGKVMEYKKGGAVKKKKAKNKKSKMGCVMAGRGGKYKGMR
jgi:hypothetical protein